MGFFRYTGRRLLHLIPVLLGISILAFLLGVLSPGDPARMALSQGVNEPTQEEIEKKREELGLNAPLMVQYGCWISRALRGDLGTSYLTKKPVLEELKRRAPITVRVAFFSFLLVILIGVSGGIYLAAAKRGILYRLVNTLSVAVISIPGFCVALILIWVFSERLRILPTSGVSGWKSYVMPAMALALPNIGSIMRLTQSSIEKEMGETVRRSCIFQRLWRVIYYFPACAAKFYDSGCYNGGKFSWGNFGRCGSRRRNFFHTGPWRICADCDFRPGLSGAAGLCSDYGRSVCSVAFSG